MSVRPKSAIHAVDQVLTILKHHDRCSYAPQLQDKEQRVFLGQICRDATIRASGADTGSARRILEDFVRSVSLHSKRSWSGPNHYLYARYLADAIRRILDEGVDPAIALGIKNRKPGRRKGAVTHNAQVLAAAYWILRRKGVAPEKCNKLIQRLTGADRTTVQAARDAPFTKAFSQPGLVSDTELKSKIVKANRLLGKALLKLLNETRPCGSLLPD
jgi:hypothetical protein